MIRTKGEAGTGNVVEAVRHSARSLREIAGSPRSARSSTCARAKELGAPVELVRDVAADRASCPVVNFSAGGIATPADAALMMQLGVDGVFVGSRHLQVRGPAADGAGDRRGDDALQRPRHPGQGLARPRRPDGRSRDRRSARRACSRPAAGSRVARRGAAVKAGVLALQGDFREHAAMLADAGATPVEVRTRRAARRRRLPRDPRRRVDHDRRSSRARCGLVEPIRERAAAGMPIFGTCAGMIVLAAARGGRRAAASTSWTSACAATRTAVRSIRSRPTSRSTGIEHPVRGVFIRAPRVARRRRRRRVLAEHAGRARSCCEQGNLLVASFHPELVGETAPAPHLLMAG